MEVLPRPIFSSTFVCVITITITIFSILLLLPPSYSYPSEDYIECARSAPFKCGSQGTFYYPLWSNSTPEHCRSPGFHLTHCENDVPTIEFVSDDSFLLLYANTSNYKLTIAPMNFLEAYICPETPQNKFLPPTFLKFSEPNKNPTLYHNCTPYPELLADNKIYACGTYILFYSNDSVLGWYDHSKCSTMEVVVNQMVFNKAQEEKKRLDDALRRVGYDVEYNSSAILCHQCESFSGKCENDSSLVQYLQTRCQPRPGPGRPFPLQSLILIIAIGAIVIGVLLAFIITTVFRRIKRMEIFRKVKKSDRDIEAFIKNYGTLAPKRYSFSDVKRMTNSYKEKLGRGGYGDVYKGNLPDGRPIAVKVLHVSKGNGEEFLNEVASIGRTSHVNVVTLLGFSLEGEKRALIYEFMPNGSLEKFIFRESTLSEDNQNLGWEKLYSIAIGIARGLEYLHRGCNTRILHLDIKPQNILLDKEFCPKIADFGLSKLCTREDSIVSILEARGTIGYIAPEVFSRSFGAVSHKSDIYSYGMMVLEMVGGKKSLQTGVSASSEYFPDWIYRHLELADELGLQGLKSKVETDTERKMILVGLWCIQIKPSDRPSIKEVIEMLEGSVEDLPIPPKPFLSSPPRPVPDSSATSSCDIISLVD